MKDYSIYKYYKGSDNYPNKKAAFFGSYERGFEHTYKGKHEDKEEAFKDYMCHLLYEQCADACMFGLPGVDKSKCFDEYLDLYFKPELHIERYDRFEPN